MSWLWFSGGLLGRYLWECCFPLGVELKHLQACDGLNGIDSRTDPLSLENCYIIRKQEEESTTALSLHCLLRACPPLACACRVTHFLSSAWAAKPVIAGRQQGRPGVRLWVCEDGLAEGVLLAFVFKMRAGDEQ